MSNNKLKKSAIFFRNYLESQDYLKLLQFDLIQLLDSSGFFYGFDYSLKGRYKTPQSIIEKIDRKGYKEIQQLTDLMGVSIVCKSQEDVPKIQNIINEHFKCVEISDYYTHTRLNLVILLYTWISNIKKCLLRYKLKTPFQK